MSEFVLSDFKEQLDRLNPKFPFSADDFNVAPEHRKALLSFLQKEVKEGNIGRLMKGVYYKYTKAFITGNKLPPSAFAIYEFLKKRDRGYLTGASIHNSLYLNTQICGGFIYASNKKPKDFKINGIRYTRVKAFVPDFEIITDNIYLLELLDSMNELDSISDCHPDDGVYVIKRHLKKLSERQISDMERLSQYYPVRVRALLGAMLGRINHQASERLRRSLPANKKNRFSLLTSQELRNMKKFNIHEVAPRF